LPVIAISSPYPPSPHYSSTFLLQSRIRRYDKPGLSGPSGFLFIWLIWFIWLVSFNQKPDKPNNGLLTLADFFSILLEAGTVGGDSVA
jgi:hypothetical protein